MFRYNHKQNTKDKLKRSISTGSNPSITVPFNLNQPYSYFSNGKVNSSKEAKSTIKHSNFQSDEFQDDHLLQDKNIYYNDFKNEEANCKESNDQTLMYNDAIATIFDENDEHKDIEVLTDDEKDCLEENTDKKINEKNTYISPMVEVIFNCEYDYDNRKFKLVQGEKLFLIIKSNDDWWLCLRLDENLTFFVPSSYVKEMDKAILRRLKPPPRPPPLPPLKTDFNHLKDQISSTINKPKVKKRNLIQTSCEINNSQTTIYENLVNFTINEDFGSLNPEAIINDLDDRLNKEEELLNKTINSVEKPPMSMASNTLMTHISSNSTLATSTPEPDSDEKHVYQNFPFSNQKLDIDDDKSKINLTTKSYHEEAKDLDIKERISFNNHNNEKLKTFDNRVSEHEQEVEKYDKDNETIRNDKSNNIDDKITKIPRGWKLEFTKYNTKCYINELNDEKWYLNYDKEGNQYFYNANNESAWELPNIFTENEADDKINECKHFNKAIDQDLPTFKNLYSRLSNSNKSRINEATTNSYSYAEQFLKKDSENSPGSRLVSTTISYSNKPPSDLNSNFKCIVLAKNGKKCRRKVSENYKVSLVSTKILFVKDSKTPKLEFFVDFKGGKCWKIETSTKFNDTCVNQFSSSFNNNKDRNNNMNKEKDKIIKGKDKENIEIIELIGINKCGFIVETLTGYKILIIHENESIVNDWIYSINSIIRQIQSEFSPIYEGPELLHSTKLADLENNRLIKNLKSNIQTNALCDIKKVHKKDCIFGCNLIRLCKKEKQNVPSFVDEIISAIEEKGLDVDGLYRISGNISEVQKVRNLVDNGKYNFKDFDIHVLCGTLKTFFRELDEPLIPHTFHQHFINSTNITEKIKRFNYVYELIKKMYLPHRETLRVLLRHLLKVIDQSSKNRMSLQNIALVFGPNIMRSNPLNDANNGFNPNIMTQNLIVEYFLLNFNDLYSFQPNSIFSEYNELL